MASNRVVCVKFLKSFACSHLDEDFFENEGWDMMNFIEQTKGSPIPKIKELKDRGNTLYKQNCFLAAASCYDDACKLLSLVVGMEDSYDCYYLSELGVSLNLNLAACALKLSEHEASRDHCSIVLSFFPKNIKALFRRGLALMKLNKFIEAKSDLEAALLIEPKNKDIQRELCVVKNYLAINLNGKRSIEELPVQAPTGNGKLQVQGEEPPLKTLRESGRGSDCFSRVGTSSYQVIDSNLSEGSSTQSSYTERCGMEIDSEKLVSDQQSCINDMASSTSDSSCSFEGCDMSRNVIEDRSNSDSERGSHDAEKKMFQFGKKGKGHSLLKIDMGTYKKLLEGKEVSFFQKSHLSILKIRVLKPSIKDSDIGSVTSYKKKRKRRKRKKGSLASNPSTLTHGIVRDVLPLSSVASNKLSDGDKPVEEVTSSLSSEPVDVNQALDGVSRGDSYAPPYFTFTSLKPNAAKVFHARRQPRRVQSRKEESPRRNVYIYSGKFPRSCDVSVSCRRSFSKAQDLKKRKNMTSSMCYSNNALKKHRVLSSPTPGLCLSSGINNVVVAPDLSSPRGFM